MSRLTKTQLASNTDFTVFALKSCYRNMVAQRLRKDKWFGYVPTKIIKPVAEQLKHVKLAKLFVEAQFRCLPPSFCKKKFGVSYPPVAVCFGGKCFERYEDYVQRGVRDGV